MNKNINPNGLNPMQYRMAVCAPVVNEVSSVITFISERVKTKETTPEELTALAEVVKSLKFLLDVF